MKLLATPYERGNADQIVSRPFPAKVAEGLAVYEDADGCHLMTTGKIPSGIAARQGLAAGEKLASGREIYVQCADDKVIAKVGDPVYIVPDTGLFSAKPAGNIKSTQPSALLKLSGLELPTVPYMMHVVLICRRLWR